MAPAVTIQKAPDLYALSKGGRTLYTFQGKGRLATKGIPAVSAITVSGGPITDGTTIPLRWNGKTVSIVARDEPSAAHEFPTGDGSAGYVDNLITFFRTYFPFREDFTVSRSDLGSFHAIVLTAKQPGPAYNVSAPAAPGHITVGTMTEGGDPLVRSQYSVYAELWARQSGETDFIRKQSFTIETNEAGQASIDVGNVLHAEMDPDWPSWSFPTPTTATRSHLEYYVAYGESFSAAPGEPQQIGRIEQDAVRHCYFGGVDYQRQGGSGVALTDFLLRDVTQPALDRALRYGSSTRFVRPDEPQFLTFLNIRLDRPGIKLDVYLKFSDNSVLDLDALYAPVSFSAGGKLTYAVGHNQLKLADYVPQGKTLLEYYVKIRTASSDYSAQYRYVLNYRYEKYVRYFAFLNSLGAVDTVATFGKGSHELSRVFEQANQFLGANYDTQLGQFVHYDVTLQQQIEVTTGYRSQAELRLLKDFYRSPYLFEMQRLRATPIALVSKSIKQYKDGDTLFAHSFQYVHRYQEEFFFEEDDPTLIGDPPPPPGLQPGGTIVVSQPTVIDSVDKTVPDAVRAITEEKVGQWNQAFVWGNHAQQGYLTQATAAQLFLRKDTGVDFQKDVKNKPNTRDGYGLSDVPITEEVKTLIESLIPTLQQITDAGNITEDDVRLGSLVLERLPVSAGPLLLTATKTADGKYYNITAIDHKSEVDILYPDFLTKLIAEGRLNGTGGGSGGTVVVELSEADVIKLRDYTTHYWWWLEDRGPYEKPDEYTPKLPPPALPTLSGGGSTTPTTPTLTPKINGIYAKYEKESIGFTNLINASGGENFMGRIIGTNGVAAPDQTWYQLSRIAGDINNGTYALAYYDLPAGGFLPAGTYKAQARIGVDNSTIVEIEIVVASSEPVGKGIYRILGPKRIPQNVVNAIYVLQEQYTDNSWRDVLNIPMVWVIVENIPGLGIAGGKLSGGDNIISVDTQITVRCFIGINIELKVLVTVVTDTTTPTPVASGILAVFGRDDDYQGRLALANATTAGQVKRTFYLITNGVEVLFAETGWFDGEKIDGNYDAGGATLQKVWGFEKPTQPGTYHVYDTWRPAGSGDSTTYKVLSPYYTIVVAQDVPTGDSIDYVQYRLVPNGLGSGSNNDLLEIQMRDGYAEQPMFIDVRLASQAAPTQNSNTYLGYYRNLALYNAGNPVSTSVNRSYQLASGQNLKNKSFKVYMTDNYSRTLLVVDITTTSAATDGFVNIYSGSGGTVDTTDLSGLDPGNIYTP